MKIRGDNYFNSCSLVRLILDSTPHMSVSGKGLPEVLHAPMLEKMKFFFEGLKSRGGLLSVF